MSNNGHDSSRKPLKTLEVVKDATFPSMLRLQFKEGGKIPKHLEGMFNSTADAQRAIDNYNDGYDRPKIYPKAPAVSKKAVSERSINSDGEEKDTGRVQ